MLFKMTCANLVDGLMFLSIIFIVLGASAVLSHEFPSTTSPTSIFPRVPIYMCPAKSIRAVSRPVVVTIVVIKQLLLHP